MGKKKKNNDHESKVVVAEFKVSMHCNACETMVAKTLLKMKGVAKFATDMVNIMVAVAGKIDPQKVLKKVEIIVEEQEKPKDVI